MGWLCTMLVFVWLEIGDGVDGVSFFFFYFDICCSLFCRLDRMVCTVGRGRMAAAIRLYTTGNLPELTPGLVWYSEEYALFFCLRWRFFKC